MSDELKVPEGWKVVRLGDVAAKTKYSFVDGPFGSNLKTEHYRSSGILVIQSNYFISGKFEPSPPIYYVSYRKAIELRRSIVKPGDILISKIGVNCGRCAILPNVVEKAVLSGNTMKLTVDKDIAEAQYITYLVNYWTDLGKVMDSIGGVTAQPALTLQGMKKLQIPLPPLPEQRKIAEILQTIDRAIEKTDRIIEKYKRIKQGLMQDLLTKGIDENGRIRSEETHRFRDSPLGRIPEEWEVVRLGDTAAKEKHAFVDGPFGSNLKRIHYTDSGILVIQSNYFIDGKFKLKPPLYYVSEKKAKELKRSIVKPGEILIAKIGVNCGKSAILPSHIKISVLSGNTIKLAPDKNAVDSRYIVFLLNYWTDIGKIKSLIASKTAQPALTLNGMKNLKIPLPSLPEQRRIAEVLEQVDAVIEEEQRYKEKLERLKRGLMEDLLTGRVRVTQLLNEGSEKNERAA